MEPRLFLFDAAWPAWLLSSCPQGSGVTYFWPSLPAPSAFAHTEENGPLQEGSDWPALFMCPSPDQSPWLRGFWVPVWARCSFLGPRRGAQPVARQRG